MKLILAAFFTCLIAEGQVSVSAPPPPPPNISVGAFGVTGTVTNYYMVVANYPAGSTQSQIARLGNANPVLTSSNYNSISWAPLPGVVGYDVIKLSNPIFTGTCTCSLTTGLSAGTTQYLDQGGSLSSYTIGAGAGGANAQIYLNTRDSTYPKLRVSLQGGQANTLVDHLAEVPSGNALPAFCTVGDVFVKLSVTAGLNVCLTPNTWTAVAGSGGGADWVTQVTNKPFIDVRSPPYSADPTGVADSTSGINAAFAACATATTGGVVYLAPGTYSVTGLTGYGNCTLLGLAVGTFSSTLVARNPTASIISSIVRQSGNTADNLTIQGVAFKGATASTANTNYGFHVTGAVNTELQNVTFYNLYRGIDCQNCVNTLVQNATVWINGAIRIGAPDSSGLSQGTTLQNVTLNAISDWSGTDAEPLVEFYTRTSLILIDNVNTQLGTVPVTRDMINFNGICESFVIQNSQYLGSKIGYNLNHSGFGTLSNSGGDNAGIGGVLLTGTTDVTVNGGVFTESTPCKVVDATCTYQYGVNLASGNTRASVQGVTIDGAFIYGMQTGTGIILGGSNGSSRVQNNTIHMSSRVGQATSISIASSEVSPTVTSNVISDPGAYGVVSLTQGTTTVVNMGTNGNIDSNGLLDFLVRTGSIMRFIGGTGQIGTALNDAPGKTFTVTAQSANGFTINVDTTGLTGTVPSVTFQSNLAIVNNLAGNTFKLISGNSVNNAFGFENALVNPLQFSQAVGVLDTIYPTGQLFSINGDLPVINTIYAPPGFYGCFTALALQGFTWGVAGNIKTAGTAPLGTSVMFCYDAVSKWWPLINMGTVTFGTLDSHYSNGSQVYCTDCKNVVDNAAAPGAACLGGGSGAIAKVQNNRYDCN